MEHRIRSQGWQHAKLSGHENELAVKQLLDSDPYYTKNFLSRFNLQKETIYKTEVGGLHEGLVPGVNGKKTKSKTDLNIILQNGQHLNISIKKSLSGQVYFIKAGLFIDTFEKQFNKKIPFEVVRGINLFWASAEDAVDIIKKYADTSLPKQYVLQISHKSLNASTLKNYNIDIYNSFINWFIDNSYEITKLSFALGAVSDKSQWSDFIWYINLLGENDVDDIFHIDTLCNLTRDVCKKDTYFTKINGGTTIRLPFGFVQWHQGQMQFHHDYYKIKELFNN